MSSWMWLLPRLRHIGSIFRLSHSSRNRIYWVLEWTKQLLGNAERRRWGELLGGVGMVMVQYGDQFGVKVMDAQEVEPLIGTALAMTLGSNIFYELAHRSSAHSSCCLVLGRICHGGVLTCLLLTCYKLQLFNLRDNFSVKIINVRDVEPLVCSAVALTLGSYFFYEMAVNDTTGNPGAVVLGRICNCGLLMTLATMSWKLNLFNMRG